MNFFRDLYYAVATGAMIGTIIGLRRRQAWERREAEVRRQQALLPLPPVPVRGEPRYHRRRNRRRWR